MGLHAVKYWCLKNVNVTLQRKDQKMLYEECMENIILNSTQEVNFQTNLITFSISYIYIYICIIYRNVTFMLSLSHHRPNKKHAEIIHFLITSYCYQYVRPKSAIKTGERNVSECLRVTGIINPSFYN